jgi:hypothetical protein
MAIGRGVTTTRTGQVLVGTPGNTYTLPGITSAASLAAQTGPLSVVTTDANGNLAAVPTNSFASSGSVAALSSQVTDLQNTVATLQHRAYEGTAVAIAMATTALPDNKRFAVTANFGTFRGENAFAASAAVRINEFLVANAAIGTGLARGGVGGRVGATFAW